ncbi:hypothetical protein KCU68_g22215, partial [Aureobasidium melanogenum]
MFGSVAVHGAAEYECIELPGIQFGCIKSILGIPVSACLASIDALRTKLGVHVQHLVLGIDIIIVLIMDFNGCLIQDPVATKLCLQRIIVSHNWDAL